MIPNGKTKISRWSFKNRKSLTKIEIPDGVTHIGRNALRGCTCLTSITIPNSVTSIGKNAFYGCPIKNATIPMMAMEHIPKNSLETLIITNGIAIGEEAFSRCYYLTSISIPDGVIYIGDGAFRGCYSLTSIKIPNSVIKIGRKIFSGCSSLANITIPFVGEAKDGKGDQHFYYLFGDAPCDVTEISKKVVITEGKTISTEAFICCDSLTNITIPDGVVSIGNETFKSCGKLESVTIPKSVTSIGRNAFDCCSSLTKVNYTGTIDQWAEIDFETNLANPLCYAKKLYINNELVTEINLTTASKISNYAFYNLSVSNDDERIACVTIPESVMSIGKYAFFNCCNLERVNYLGTTDGWVQIKFDCEDIQSSNPLAEAKNLYINNELLTDAKITTATEISNGAFINCYSLISVTIGSGVTKIGRGAFDGCINLEKATFLNAKGWYSSIKSNETSGLNLTLTDDAHNAYDLKNNIWGYWKKNK